MQTLTRPNISELKWSVQQVLEAVLSPSTINILQQAWNATSPTARPTLHHCSLLFKKTTYLQPLTRLICSFPWHQRPHCTNCGKLPYHPVALTKSQQIIWHIIISLTNSHCRAYPTLMHFTASHPYGLPLQSSKLKILSLLTTLSKTDQCYRAPATLDSSIFCILHEYLLSGGGLLNLSVRISSLSSFIWWWCFDICIFKEPKSTSYSYCQLWLWVSLALHCCIP